MQRSAVHDVVTHACPALHAGAHVFGRAPARGTTDRASSRWRRARDRPRPTNFTSPVISNSDHEREREVVLARERRHVARLRAERRRRIRRLVARRHVGQLERLDRAVERARLQAIRLVLRQAEEPRLEQDHRDVRVEVDPRAIGPEWRTRGRSDPTRRRRDRQRAIGDGLLERDGAIEMIVREAHCRCRARTARARARRAPSPPSDRRCAPPSSCPRRLRGSRRAAITR